MQKQPCDHKWKASEQSVIGLVNINACLYCFKCKLKRDPEFRPLSDFNVEYVRSFLKDEK